MKLLIVLLLSCATYAQTTTWKNVDKGFDVGKYKSPQPSLYGTSVITILKIDPEEYNFNIFSDKADPKTAHEWADEKKLIAVVNAGMYDRNGVNMGYMQEYNSLFNPKMNSDNATLAFNPKDNSVPSVQIIDMVEGDWNKLALKYNSFTQSIRMVTLSGKNVWSQTELMWSVVVVAIDKKGNVLFIHCRSPYTMHDFVNILLGSDLNISNVMYLEGGPEASMYIEHNGSQIAVVGSYETDFYGDDNMKFWHIPNIIGITKK